MGEADEPLGPCARRLTRTYLPRFAPAHHRRLVRGMRRRRAPAARAGIISSSVPTPQGKARTAANWIEARREILSPDPAAHQLQSVKERLPTVVSSLGREVLQVHV